MTEERTFNNLQNQLMSLYNEKAYAAALELVQRESDQFPDRRRETYYWGMCLASRLNNIPQALQFFKDALALDLWFPPMWIRDDEDLQPLQELPEYQQMLKICQQKLAEIEAHVKPELTVVPPEGLSQKSESSAHPMIIALHSNSGNAHSSVNAWRWIASQGWLLALPQSSQVIGPDAYIWNDFDKATHEVQEHYALLTKEHAIDTGRVVVGGFSMGGGLAIWLAVSRAIKARGFVVLGPYLRDVDVLLPYLEAAKADGVRGYIIMGEQENAEGQQIVRKVVEFLNSHGIPCELELRPNLAHAYPPDFELSLEKAIAFIERPE